MTKAAYWQRGESLDYINETTTVIEAGTVIELHSMIGVAGTDILPKMLGSVHVAGVYTMPKKTGEAFEIGQMLFFDGNELTTDETSNRPAGYAAQNATADDEVAYIKLLG